MAVQLPHRYFSHILLHGKSLIFFLGERVQIPWLSLFALQTSIILIALLWNVTARIKSSTSWL